MDDWKSKLGEMKAAREASSARKIASSNSAPTTPSTTTVTTSPTTTPPSTPPIENNNNNTPSSNEPSADNRRGSFMKATTPTTSAFQKRTSLLDFNKSGSPRGPNTDWKALYETEAKIKETIEKEKELKDKEIAMLKEKIVEFSLSDHAKQVLGAGGNLARELNLLKTEQKVTNMKLEAEIRKREGAERELQEVKDELRLLKEKREGAAKLVEQTKAIQRKRKMELQAQRLQMQAEKVAVEKSTQAPTTTGSGGSHRATPSYRTSKKVQPVGGQTNIVELVTRVLSEMQKLEGNIKKAEAGRMQAEGELLEVAMFKQASDEALESVVNDVKVQLIFFGQQVSQIESICQNKLSSLPEVQTSLTQVQEKLMKIRVDVEQRLDNGKSSIKDTQKLENISKRASVFVEQLNLAPPPPPLPPRNIPHPPNSPNAPPAPNINLAPPPPPKAARTSTLLDQIRKGKNLNKIDMDCVKKDREQQLSSNRKSISLLSSLQETLRAALAMRQDDMNLYDEEDEDFDEEEEWE